MSSKPRVKFFRVTGPRFDWMPKRGVMVAYKHGYEGPGTKACVAKGLSLGLIVEIPRPEGQTIAKGRTK